MQADGAGKKSLRSPLIALALSVAATVVCFLAVVSQPERREALYHAGDAPLPSAQAFQEAAKVAKVVQVLAEHGREAYAATLKLDSLFVILLLASALSLAWLNARLGHRRAFWLLFATAALFAAADLTENLLLRWMLAAPATAAAYAGWAVAATSAKWILVWPAALVMLGGVLRIFGGRRAWAYAFFQDMPSVIDSLWRRADLVANSEFRYHPAPGGTGASAEPQPWTDNSAFVWFAMTIGFVAYGPTPDAFCSLAPGTWAWVLPLITGGLSLLVLSLLLPLRRQVFKAIDFRFALIAASPEREERRVVTRAAMIVAGALLLAPLIFAAGSLFYPAVEGFTFNGCKGAEFSKWSWARLGVCLGAIALFAWCCSSTQDSGKLARRQALIAVVAAVIFWFLAVPGHREADGTGYRHIFSVLAPALILVVGLAPWVADLVFSREPQKVDELRREFRRLLGRRELFVRRGQEPALTTSRVIFAVLRSLTYRAMQLLLPPGIFAFVAPSDWIVELAVYGFLIGLLLSTWGNLWQRWAQMVNHIDRWFLQGAAWFVSLFVIAVGFLRLANIDYVTTIVDAAPFGVLFAMVLMSYVMAWLVEYWINRVLAARLLELLGDANGRAWIDYVAEKPGEGIPGEGILVHAEGRKLGYHGLGRFVVVGTLMPGHEPVGNAPAAGTAFHSYDLLGLFRALARRETPGVAEVARFSGLYFYAMNLLIVAVFVGFAILHSRAASKPPATVVVAAADAGPGGRDLARRLLVERKPKPGVVRSNTRPALVVVASGGGSRAALYTSYVLEGLHNLNVDGDIVLASGVSGGGVALAYYAARHDELTGRRKELKDRSGAWEKFRKDVGGNLIRDVLEGAAEWRIFQEAPLTALLYESFDRNLLVGAPYVRMGTNRGPALILNTAITGHPAEDSEVLARTLDPAGKDCGEADRPFKKMAGGRLIFTNLKTTDAFPKIGTRIPDTRLPYVIVTDRAVEVSRAAALNANFPPVFPNARVELVRRAAAPCPDRSYYVTDGGAQENLGLVSALYGVISALEELKGEARGKQLKLRPLHFVIAEASGTGYDYTQDRGLGAVIGDAKERMTGGITNELLQRVEDLYVELGGDKAQVKVHYLALPLVFRARGGLGTHWMLADKFVLHDPRPRSPSAESVTISKDEIQHLWAALHNATTPFCSRHEGGTIVTDRVQRWICGSDQARDLHIDAWRSLVTDLRHTDPPEPDSPRP